MAEGKKFYAVAVGTDTGLFYDTWDNVRAKVDGYSGARYKGFKNEEEATKYLTEHGVAVNPTCKSMPLFTDKEISELTKGEDKVTPFDFTVRESKSKTPHKPRIISSEPSKSTLATYPQVYSDGSYDKTTGFYGYSTIVLIDGQEPYIRYGKGKAGKDNGWQVNGEVAGAVFGIDYLLRKGYTKMVVNYDLINIERWGNAEWKANKSYSKRYRDYIYDKREEGAKIYFNKVKAHSGNKYNEWADYYAKKGLGITKYDNLDAM